jgi:U3 small nucleolar RNA-associated protein 19
MMIFVGFSSAKQRMFPHSSSKFKIHGILRSLLLSTPNVLHPYLPTNLLSILERLTTFPTDLAELNSWWVTDDHPASDADPTDDDWRKFFDDTTNDPTDSKMKLPAERLHKLTVHQSLRSLPSHRAVFTRAWLTLLPRLSQGAGTGASTAKALAIRALNVMHREVMPHLTRPVLVMDWVGASVDFGGFFTPHFLWC